MPLPLSSYFYGVTIDFISLPMGTTIHFGFLSIPITVIWIVAITNAINLIDGLDGLASGIYNRTHYNQISLQFTS
ncbi:hypothetical protein ACVXZZ_10570 [Staphylococcus aureus]